MQITHRLMAIMLDGQEHSLPELIGMCQGVLPPEQLARAYLRRANKDGEGADLDTQVRGGLEWTIFEALQNLVFKGDCESRVSKGVATYKLSLQGFERAVKHGPGCIGGKVWENLRQIVEGGAYYVTLVPRNTRTPRETRPLTFVPAGADDNGESVQEDTEE